MKSKPSSRSNDWRDSKLHRTLAMKAGNEAKRVLRFFVHERPIDPRPRAAIDAVLAWAAGKRSLDMATVRKLALASHAAARASRAPAAIAAARAAGQAVATWHAPAHSLASFSYAQKAIFAAKQKKGSGKRKKFSTEELAEALRAVTSLISKLTKVEPKLRKGSAQHSLVVNRLKALRVSATLIGNELSQK